MNVEIRSRTSGPAAAAARPTCLAPSTAMYLDPSGNVQACCMNSWHRLGNVAERSLLDIWRSPAADHLRTALAAGDHSHGCELCEHAGPAAYARVFDRPTGAIDPRWPRRLDLALSNTCNLQCTMCNGDLSSAIRSHREGRPPLPQVYDDRFFDELTEFLPHLDSVNFVGGEPFLGRPQLRVMELLLAGGHRPACHVTTNGTHWTPRIEALVTSLPMHVSVSLDAATASTFEAIRIGADHEVVLANIERFRRATATTGAGLSLSFCLMRQNHDELRPLLRWADELDVDVFVNQVDYPASHSLRSLPVDELDGVLAAWDREAATEPALRRNAAVMAQEHARVTTWRDDLARRDGAASGGLDDAEVARRARTTIGLLAPGAGVVTVEASADQIVGTVDAEPSADLPDLGASHGASMLRVLSELELGLGERREMQIDERADGIEVRRLTFGDPPRRTTVVGVRAARADGGQLWFFAREPATH